MLTPKQEAFCQHFAVHRRNAEAYAFAYDTEGMSPKTLHEEACRVRKNYKVAARIMELERLALEESGLTHQLADLFRRELALSLADPSELTVVRVGNCRYCNGDDFRYRWADDEFAGAVARAETLNAPLPDIAGGLGFRPFHEPRPDCPQCGGMGVPHAGFKPTDELSPMGRLLFRGVKKTRDGLEVLLADQQKATDNVIRMSGGFKDNVNLTATLAAAVQQLPPDATPETATRAYEALVRGGKPG